MLSKVLHYAEPALAGATPEAASRAFYDALRPMGVTYLQTRHYTRPSATLTSESHFAAGGVIARIAKPTWPGSGAFNYICFEQNPLLAPIREGRTRYRFSDFAPHDDRQFGAYWEAMGEAGIGDALCATSYGADRAIASLHLGFERAAIMTNDAQAISLAGLMLTEHLMSFGGAIPAEPVRLTRRERDCLAYVAEGKSDWEISVILSISEATARFHVDNARRKLGAVTRAQAVAKLVNMRMM
jgi:LuxR family transcriptional regulator, quorum-sensing system regulator BjaR1